MMNHQPTLHIALFKFLKAIREENSRKYFASIRPLYDDIWNNLQEFIQAVITTLAHDDPALANVKPKECLFRIYRDARRLRPRDYIYKNNRGAYITSTGKKSPQAGYYLHFQSGGSFLGGGIYRPTAAELKKIRTFLTQHGAEYYAITSDPIFVDRFGSVQGEILTKIPRGFHSDVAYPELIRRKQFLIYHHYTDEQVLAPDFFEVLISDCRIAQPFFDLLNTALTHDDEND